MRSISYIRRWAEQKQLISIQSFAKILIAWWHIYLQYQQTDDPTKGLEISYTSPGLDSGQPDGWWLATESSWPEWILAFLPRAFGRVIILSQSCSHLIKHGWHNELLSTGYDKDTIRPCIWKTLHMVIFQQILNNTELWQTPNREVNCCGFAMVLVSPKGSCAGILVPYNSIHRWFLVEGEEVMGAPYLEGTNGILAGSV